MFYERVVAYSVPGVDMDMAGASIDRQRASVQTIKTAFDTVGGTLAVCVRVCLWMTLDSYCDSGCETSCTNGWR